MAYLTIYFYIEREIIHLYVYINIFIYFSSCGPPKQYILEHFQSFPGKILHQKVVRNELKDLHQYAEYKSDFFELLSTHCQKLCVVVLENIQSNSTDLIVLLQSHCRAERYHRAESVDTAQKCTIRFSGVKLFHSLTCCQSVSCTVLISVQYLLLHMQLF